MKKQTVKCGNAIYNGVDSCKWATKMEINHLLSGKRDLKIKAVEKETVAELCSRHFAANASGAI